MRKKRAVVAMSGGVDSSVAAAQLLEEGYDVVGVTLSLFSLPGKHCRDEYKKSCCGWGTAEDAHQVCLKLKIPHYVVDMRDIFERKVVNDFCLEYLNGRTPNPCIRCNEFIKFDELMKRMEKLKADYLATGHHARIERDSKSKKYVLKKGVDLQKDQSYFLYTLNQSRLQRILMPIGYFTKKSVREKAVRLGLPVARRPESQEICFVPDNDYAFFLHRRIPQAFRPGPIIDAEGRVLGRHKGIPGFTVGQRRGMGIAAPDPLYVLEIDTEKNAIIAGPNGALYKKNLEVSDVNIISGSTLKGPLRIKAKIRYKHKESAAVLKPAGEGRVRLRFDTAQRAVTPGQAVVFYDGETVVGGGLIEKGLRP